MQIEFRVNHWWWMFVIQSFWLLDQMSSLSHGFAHLNNHGECLPWLLIISLYCCLLVFTKTLSSFDHFHHIYSVFFIYCQNSLYTRDMHYVFTRNDSILYACRQLELRHLVIWCVCRWRCCLISEWVKCVFCFTFFVNCFIL